MRVIKTPVTAPPHLPVPLPRGEMKVEKRESFISGQPLGEGENSRKERDNLWLSSIFLFPQPLFTPLCGPLPLPRWERLGEGEKTVKMLVV